MTEFVILYTHQKQKKAKTWQDGILRVLTTGRKAAIYDDKNNKIDTIFLKNGEVSVGEEMESDRYLLQVECVRPDQNNAAPEQTPGSGQVSGSNSIAVTSVQPSSTGIRGSVKQVPRFVGLKRKKTGFNPPRLVKPKIEESVMIEDNLKPLRSELKHRPSFQIPRPLTEASSEGQYLSENNSFNTQGDVSEFLNVKKQVVKVETSMPSPWSIVGKSKLKTFQTGSRNNSQNDSQNSDRKEVDNFVKDGSQEVRHNPLFTSKKQEGNVCHIDDVNEVTEICEDKTSSKFALRQTGQNKLREKRSTSQILALIAETESTKGDMNDLTSSHTEYAQVGQQHAQNCVGENESETIMSERVGFTMCNDRRQQLQSTSVELDDGLNSEVSKETEGEKKKVEWKDSLNAITRSPQFGFQAFNTDRSDFNVKIVETSDCGESIGKSGFDVINVAGCSVIENSARQSAKDCSSVRTIDDSSQCKGDASRGSQVCNGAGEEANEAVNESCGQETEKTDLDTVLMDEEKCLRKRTDPSDYIHQRSILQSEDICDDIPSDFWEKNHLLTGSEPQKNKCTAKTDSTETRCFNIIEKSNVKVLDKRLDENSGRVETDEVDGASGQVGNYLSQRSEEGHVTGENNDNVEDELETACFDINFSPFSDDSFSDYETVACVEKEGESDELLFNTEKYIAPGSGSFEGDVNSDKVVGAECSMQHIRSNERNNSNVEKMLKGKDMACPAKKSSDGTFSSAKVNLDINKRKFNLTEHGNLATSSTQTVVSEHICKENRLKGSGDECVTVEIANSELAKSNIDYPSGYKENETSGSYAEDHVEKEGRSFSQESTTLKQDIGISLSQDQLIYVGQEKAENVLRISNLSVKDEKTDSVELASFANSSQFLPCNVVHQNNLSLANPVAAEKKELDSVEKSISGKFHVGGEQSRPELSKLIGKSSNEGKPMFTLSGLDLSPDDSQYGLGETDKQSLDERLFKTVQHSGIFSTVNEKTGYPEPWKIDTKPRSGNEEMIQDKKLVTLSSFEGIPAAEQIGALCSAKTCTHDNTVNTSEEVKIRPMLHDSSKKGSSYSMNYEKLDRTVDRYQENGINKNVIQHFSNAKSENNDVSVPAVDNVKNVANFPNVTNWEEMSDNWRSQTDSCRTSDTMFTYTSETESEEASQTQGIMGSVEKVSEVHTQDCRNIQREDLSQTMTPGVSGGRHGLLPHPSQLMGKTLGRVNTEQHYQGREERTDLLQAAQEKPVSYSVSGSVRSGTVRKRQEEMDEFNRDRVNADLVLEQMSSPDLESSQEHSLYPFNSDECIKKHFSHENLFMVTPKDVFSKRNVQKASPAQCVPESGDLDLGEKSCPMMTSVTNSLDLESSQEHSLYPFNSDECIKKHFSHENLFMVTPKDVFSKRNVQKASPAQCVPESGDLDLGEKSCPMMTSVTNSLESRLKRVREPVKCQPFGDETRQQSGEVEKWYSQLSTERDGMPAIRSTPEHRKLPVWMSESPGDLSFTLSPYPDYKPVKSISYTDHRPPKCNPHTDQRPSSSHHMASQSTCISLVGLDSDSQEPLEEQKCIQVLRERREIESSSCSKFQALINTCSGTDALTTQTVHDQLVTQTQSLLPNSSRNMPDHGCSTSQIKLNSLRGSRWSRFQNQSQEEKQETVPNKPYSISSRHETNYDHNLHSNSDQNPCESFKNRNAAQEVLLQSASVLYKSTNAPGKGTYVPIQGTGVDHLVCSSPPVKTEVELTSDLSTDNDSQCLSDVYFDIETPKQETKESDSLCASKVNRFAGSKRTDQICPQKYDTITHMGGDFDGKERVSEITGEVPRISRQFCNKANYLLGRPNMKRDRSKKYSPVPCINSKDICKSDGNPCDTDRMDIRLNSNIIDSIEGQVPQKSHFRLSPVSCVGNTPGSDECPPVTDHCVEPYQLLASDRHCTQMYNSELSELRSHPVHGANDTKGMANLHRNALSKPFKKHVGLTYNPSVSVNSISTSEDPVGSVVPKTRDLCVQGRGFIPPRPSGSSCVNSSAGESRGFTVPASKVTGNSVVPSSQRNLCGDLHFPSKSEAEENVSPCRQITIPVCFTSVSAYKQVLKQALQEYLNVQLFELSKLYHSALSKLDLSGYTPFTADSVCRSAGVSGSSRSNNPVCEHGQPSKIVQVKKEGPNKGRFFFACNNARDNQCKFFKWADDSACGKVNSSSATTVTSGTQDRTGASKKLSSGLSLTDGASIGTFFKGRRLQVYCESIFLRKVPDAFKSQRSNATAWVKNRKTDRENTRKKLYIALSRKESSSLFAKDDLWVVSQKLTFDPGCTFVARSVFYGPSTSNEVEIEPLTGFCPSNWQNHSEF